MKFHMKMKPRLEARIEAGYRYVAPGFSPKLAGGVGDGMNPLATYPCVASMQVSVCSTPFDAPGRVTLHSTGALVQQARW